MNWLTHKLLLLLTTWLPVWAFYTYHLPFKSWRWYLTAEIVLGAMNVWFVYNPFKVEGLTSWVHYYIFFLMVHLLIVGESVKYREFSKVLSMGLFIIFIAGEIWEIPIYIYDFLGKAGIIYNKYSGTLMDFDWIQSHIRRLYTLASTVLFLQVTGVNNRIFYSISALTILTSFITLIPFAMPHSRLISLIAFSNLTRVFSLSMSIYGVYAAKEKI